MATKLAKIKEAGITPHDAKRERIASEIIAAVVHEGKTLTEALKGQEISETTWYRWLNEGKVTHLLVDTRDQVREAARLRMFSKADKMIERMLDIGLGTEEDANPATQLRALTTMLLDMMGMESPREGASHGLRADEYLELVQFEPSTVVVQNIQTQVISSDQKQREEDRKIEEAVEGSYQVIENGGGGQEEGV